MSSPVPVAIEVTALDPFHTRPRCWLCDGGGYVTVDEADGQGRTQGRTTCVSCLGSGEDVYCRSCVDATDAIAGNFDPHTEHAGIMATRLVAPPAVFGPGVVGQYGRRCCDRDACMGNAVRRVLVEAQHLAALEAKQLAAAKEAVRKQRRDTREAYEQAYPEMYK